MEMPEIHPAVEAGNVRARVGVDESALIQKVYRKATLRMVLHLVLALAVIVGFWLAVEAGLVAWVLAVPFECAAMAAAAFWLGAWAQFMFAREGLLK